jgi:outer membrane receptor protein involved in Fe transport
LLDYDQRNTLHIGGQYSLPWHSCASTDVHYASDFTNGNPPPDHLQSHTTFDLTLSKDFAEKFSVSVNGINVANRRALLDNSFTRCALYKSTRNLRPDSLPLSLLSGARAALVKLK